MKRMDRRALVQASLAFAVSGCASATAAGPFVCPPCGCAADGREFSRPGVCPECGMGLVPRGSLETPLPFEPESLVRGAGAFEAAGGIARPEKRIGVHYYFPSGFSRQTSKVLIVIPGAGRNGDAYRDAWIDEAERANVLVAALSFPERDYDFAAYQMGGVIRDLELRNLPVGPNGQAPTSVHLRDEDIRFSVNMNRSEWIFADFDRIFDLLVRASGSAARTYDAFGHSAGGQILHRLALYAPNLRAERIVAANSGLYTLPDLDEPQPVGLADTGVTPEQLREAFQKRLIILLGEEDNDSEEGGIQIHTPLIDRQGTNRLARGRFFFARALREADELGVPLGWRLQTIPGVGHDFRAVSRTAARLLYP